VVCIWPSGPGYGREVFELLRCTTVDEEVLENGDAGDRDDETEWSSYGPLGDDSEVSGVQVADCEKAG
jgi:hypothetical protein